MRRPGRQSPVRLGYDAIVAGPVNSRNGVGETVPPMSGERTLTVSCDRVGSFAPKMVREAHNGGMYSAVSVLTGGLCPQRRPVNENLPHDESMSWVAYCPDGQWLATLSAAGQAQVFRGALDTLVSSVQDRMARSLSVVERKNCAVSEVLDSPFAKETYRLRNVRQRTKAAVLWI